MAILGLRVRWYSNETRYGELDVDPPAVEDLGLRAISRICETFRQRIKYLFV